MLTLFVTKDRMEKLKNTLENWIYKLKSMKIIFKKERIGKDKR